MTPRCWTRPSARSTGRSGVCRRTRACTWTPVTDPCVDERLRQTPSLYRQERRDRRFLSLLDRSLRHRACTDPTCPDALPLGQPTHHPTSQVTPFAGRSSFSTPRRSGTCTTRTAHQRQSRVFRVDQTRLSQLTLRARLAVVRLAGKGTAGRQGDPPARCLYGDDWPRGLADRSQSDPRPG